MAAPARPRTHASILYYKISQMSIGKSQKVGENFTFFVNFLAKTTQNEKNVLFEAKGASRSHRMLPFCLAYFLFFLVMTTPAATSAAAATPPTI
ncbi:MAG: hypothetical protein J6R04_08630, partial [Clostridia bacterium]|nr:hypothetical protein [Clostridia bacterium]